LGNLVFILLGLALLIAGGNWLLKSAVALSLKLNIPKIVIGMTVVSFATSAPELIVSIKAALDGFPDIALGNVVGSNIANLGLVLAITVILRNIEVRKSFYTTDWPVMMVASLLFFGFIYFDGQLGQTEGIVLVSSLFVFLVYLLRFQKTAVVDDMPEDDIPLPLYKTALFLGLGGVALWGGSELLIDGAVGLASSFGVSDRVIGITVVSVGTSIPELAASVIAVIKKEKAISVGNLIGSNIFNFLFILGITGLIFPIKVDKPTVAYEVPFSMIISLILLLLINDHLLGNIENKLDTPHKFPELKTPLENIFREHVEKEQSLQSSIYMGKRCKTKSHPLYPGMLLLNEVFGGYFGSRLMQNIREDKGYTYGIHSYITSLKDGAYFVISSDVKKEFKDLVINEIEKEIEKIKTKPIGQNELNQAKNHLKGSILNTLTNPFAVTEKLKNIYFYDLRDDFYDHLFNEIDRLQSDELLDLAKNDLFNRPLSSATVG